MARILAGDAPVTLMVDGRAHHLNPGDPIPVDDVIPVGCPTESVADDKPETDTKPAVSPVKEK